jgi:hypothetical protein
MIILGAATFVADVGAYLGTTTVTTITVRNRSGFFIGVPVAGA